MQRTFAVPLAAMILAAAIDSAWSLSADTDVSRYAVIVDRCPFGKPAPPPPPPVSAEVAAQNAADANFWVSLRICYMGWDPETGVTCAFLDNKTGRPSFLNVGGKPQEDGISLVDADYDRGGALLRKGAVEQWLYIDGASGASASGSSRTSAINSSAVPPGTIAPPGPLRRRSPAERMTRRKVAQPPALSGEALDKHHENYQMDLIRSAVLSDGEMGPPLPMQLSPEMDDQLVKEGVLPALE